MIKTLTAGFLLALLLPATGCKWISAVSHGGRGYSEKLLCHTDPSKVTLSIISPDLRHVAQVVKVGERLAIALDGKIGQAYDDIDGKSLTFSPDSKRLAYAAETGSRWAVVLDGAPGKSYASIRKPGIIFSPDSKRVAYAAQDEGRCFVVVDGANGPGYDIVFDPVFSPDSRSLAYGALEFGQVKMFLVLDGQNEKSFDLAPYFHPNASFGISALTFSPDSKRIAYVAELAGKRTFVVDGQGAGPFDTVESVLFSPDSRHVGYIAGTSFGQVLVNKHDDVGGGARNREAAVIDGKEGKLYNYINGLTFSPDSARTAYHAEENGKHFAVVDGEEQERCDGMYDGPVFSPDSRRVAYAARNDTGVHLVVSGREGKVYGKSYHGVFSIRFSPDSERLAYMVDDGAKHFEVIDVRDGEIYGKSYSGVYGLLFSPDSGRVAYMAYDGAKQFVVVDGIEGKPYGAIPNATILFDSPKSLHYDAIEKTTTGIDLIVVDEVFSR